MDRVGGGRDPLRAEGAWSWATANPNVIFRNNEQSAGTGGLGAGQQEVDDAGRANLRLVAAIYLFALTGDAGYRDFVDANYTRVPMFASFWRTSAAPTSASERR